jgi:hypothetical protein
LRRKKLSPPPTGLEVSKALASAKRRRATPAAPLRSAGSHTAKMDAMCQRALRMIPAHLRTVATKAHTLKYPGSRKEEEEEFNRLPWAYPETGPGWISLAAICVGVKTGFAWLLCQCIPYKRGGGGPRRKEVERTQSPNKVYSKIEQRGYVWNAAVHFLVCPRPCRQVPTSKLAPLGCYSSPSKGPTPPAPPRPLPPPPPRSLLGPRQQHWLEVSKALASAKRRKAIPAAPLCDPFVWERRKRAHRATALLIRGGGGRSVSCCQLS